MNTIAIIGGGPSGLVTAKEARQNGLAPIIFEQGSSIGGVWKQEGGSAWRSMRINNSRHACNFSDFDWDKSSEDFPNQKHVYEYLYSYAKEFNILNAVQLNSRVTKIEKEGSRWRVQWLSDKNRYFGTFNYVVVCSGVFSKPFIPQIPGINSFPGHIIHSQEYKIPAPFKGKRVIVIGNSFSGCDIAAEISKTARVVFHLFDKARWIHSRYLKQGDSSLPFDLTYRRFAFIRNFNTNPSTYNELANKRLNNLCRLQGKLSPNLAISGPSTNPPKIVITDTYLKQVEEGKLLPCNNTHIERVLGKTIYLSSRCMIPDIDNIVCCTGYTAELPFFSEEIKEELDFRHDDTLQPLPLYKTVFHPKLQNLAFVGLTRIGIYFGLIELQARWACMTFSGRAALPSKEAMEEGVMEEKKIRDFNPRPQFSHNYFRLCDELASQIGALPDYTMLQANYPDLYEQLWNGPFTVASYRLFGFGHNRGIALQKIEDLYKRSQLPLSSPICSYKEITWG